MSLSTSRSLLAVACVASLCVAGVGGCYTDAPRLQHAQDLGKKVAAYRDSQKERIDRLNAGYRDAFSRRMDELTRLADAQFRADRDMDAQRLTDALIADYDAQTLPSRLRDSVAAVVDAERVRIRKADDDVAAARAAYVAAYKDASLELDRLDQVKAKLDALGAPEDPNQTAADLISRIAKIYRTLKDEADQEAGKQPTGGAVPPPPATKPAKSKAAK